MTRHKTNRERWSDLQKRIVRPALKQNEEIDRLLNALENTLRIPGGFLSLDAALDDLAHTPTIEEWNADSKRLKKLLSRLQSIRKRGASYRAKLFSAIEKEQDRLQKSREALENAFRVLDDILGGTS